MRHLKKYKSFFEDIEIDSDDLPDEKFDKSNINDQSDYLKEYKDLKPKIDAIYSTSKPENIEKDLEKIITKDNNNPYLSSYLKTGRLKREVDDIKKKQIEDKIKLDDFKRDLTLLAPNVDKTSINNKIIEINIRLSDYTKKIDEKTKELQKIIIEDKKKMSEIESELKKDIADIEKK